jgi:hypothetical protein
MLVKTIKFNFLFSNRLCYNICVFFALFAFITFVSGCTVFTGVSRKTKHITRGFKERDEDMKKMIGMAPFNNRTRLSDPNQETNFSETLIENAETLCSGVHILYSGAVGYPEFLADLPKQGQGEIDNLELAKEGRLFGLNAILTIALTGINSFEEEKGFWWFKDTHNFIRVQIKVEMYDTETGTKLLDEIISRDIEVELFDIELLENQERFDVFLLEDAYEYFASTIAEKVCDALTIQPWKGYIVSVAGNKIILSSGETSRLVLGQVLEVFDSSEIIQGTDGHRFFMPGPKTGEIRITAVYDDSAEAAISTDSVVQVGNLVKTKD